MRCRKALRLIGPYIDGEAAGAQAQALERHLDACAGCSRRLELMRGLVREISALPTIVPTPQESYRLMNRLRSEAAAPAATRTYPRRVQLAAAALSLLVVATLTGVGIALWSSGGTAPESRDAAVESAQGGNTPPGGGEREETGPAAGGTGSGALVTAALARPELVVSGKEYAPQELESFRNDLGARLDFYSTYWYPAGGGVTESGALADLQQDLTDELALQAAAAGQDPDEVKTAVKSALRQEAGEPVLPCYAERAKVNGQEVWLISVSGPEDYLLFPDPQRPPAMFLASLGGEEGLKVSESLLRELAATLAPAGESGGPFAPASRNVGQPATAPDTAVPEAEPALEEEATEEERRGDFQSFLRGLAAQGTSLDLISALEGLNYEQVIMLLHGDWAALAAGGVNLSDFLTPPKRLWAVGCATGEILWGPR